MSKMNHDEREKALAELIDALNEIEVIRDQLKNFVKGKKEIIKALEDRVGELRWQLQYNEKPGVQLELPPGVKVEFQNEDEV